MTNLFDYLTWRGDLPLSSIPFCAVDGLILSTLSYVHFDELLPNDPKSSVPLGETATKYLALPEEERGRCRSKYDPMLFEMLAGSERFSHLGLTFYRDIFRPEDEMQFSAVTVLLEDGSAFLAFRGTDSTFVGWKEDFNLAYQDTVPAQRAALAYLTEFAESFNGPLRLGGHSKGGNLAVFAAAMCPEEIRNRILTVYNNDGPGFTEYVLSSPGYRAVVPKIETYVPQSSVIGMLLDHEEGYTVVKSRQIGIWQHDPYSWEILGGNFICLEQITEGSRNIDRTMKAWLSEMSPEERGEFVDTLFHVISPEGVTFTAEMHQPKNLYAAFQTFLHTDEATRQKLLETLSRLAQTAAETVREDYAEKRADTKSKRKLMKVHRITKKTEA